MIRFTGEASSVRMSVRLSSINFVVYQLCFFSVRFCNILMKLVMNGLRAMAYKVIWQILNICSN